MGIFQGDECSVADDIPSCPPNFLIVLIFNVFIGYYTLENIPFDYQILLRGYSIGIFHGDECSVPDDIYAPSCPPNLD